MDRDKWLAARAQVIRAYNVARRRLLAKAAERAVQQLEAKLAKPDAIVEASNERTT